MNAIAGGPAVGRSFATHHVVSLAYRHRPAATVLRGVRRRLAALPAATLARARLALFAPWP